MQEGSYKLATSCLDYRSLESSTSSTRGGYHSNRRLVCISDLLIAWQSSDRWICLKFRKKCIDITCSTLRVLNMDHRTTPFVIWSYRWTNNWCEAADNFNNETAHCNSSIMWQRWRRPANNSWSTKWLAAFSLIGRWSWLVLRHQVNRRTCSNMLSQQNQLIKEAQNRVTKSNFSLTENTQLC